MAVNPLLPVPPSGVPLVEIHPPFRPGGPLRVVNRPEWVLWYNRMRTLLAPDGGPYQLAVEKDQASGYLGLDANARFAATKIADGTVSNTEFLLLNGRTGTLIDTAATTLVGAGFFLDEDTMSSNSATKVASQQSIKAYVDAEVAGAGGALSVVSAQDATSQTTVDFTTGITSGFDYELEAAGLKTTNDDDGVRIRVGDSGGFKTTGYKLFFRINYASGTVVPINSVAGAYVATTNEATAGGALGNAATESMRLMIRFSGDDFVSTSLHALVNFDGAYIDSNATPASISDGMFVWTGGAGALDRIQLLTESGNGFTAGDVTLRKKARS